MSAHHHSLSSRSFCYDNICRDSFRVLLLYSGRHEDILQGELQSYAVNSTANYAAISYAWGLPVFDCSLKLSGGSLGITKSLDGALRKFRNEDTSTMLWADQVCINQADKTERSEQVALMSRIYSQAESVLIWLGPDVARDHVAFQAIASILDRVPGESLSNLRSRVAKDICGGTADLYALRQDLMFMKHARLFDFASETLSELLERPYFHRLWPVQELILARTAPHDRYAGSWPNVTFHCGKYDATFAEVSLCLATFEHTVSDPLYAPRKPWLFSKSWCHSRVLKTAMLTMVETYELQASEVHDKLYAIRNLTTDGISETLTPDYELPAAELWRRAVICSLNPQHNPETSMSHTHKHHHQSVVLALAGLSRIDGNELLWSWVPDLARLTAQHLKKVEQYENTQYHAGRSSTASHDLQQKDDLTELSYDAKNPDLLRVSGVLAATVQDVLDHSQWKSAYSQPRLNTKDAREVILWYLRCRLFVHQRNQTSSTILENFGGLLRQAQLEWGDSAPVSESEYPSLIRVAISQHASTTVDHVDIETVYRDLAYVPDDGGRFREMLTFDNTNVLAYFSDGRFGWVPPASKRGDLAVILQGAPFPFIFRQRKDHSFENLGDCYVHGVMYGELWSVKDDGKDAETFITPMDVR